MWTTYKCFFPKRNSFLLYWQTFCFFPLHTHILRKSQLKFTHFRPIRNFAFKIHEIPHILYLKIWFKSFWKSYISEIGTSGFFVHLSLKRVTRELIGSQMEKMSCVKWICLRGEWESTVINVIKYAYVNQKKVAFFLMRTFWFWLQVSS